MNANIWSPIHLFYPGFMWMHQGYQSDACECDQLLTAIMTNYQGSLNQDIDTFFCPLMKMLLSKKFPNFNKILDSLELKLGLVHNFAIAHQGNQMHKMFVDIVKSNPPIQEHLHQKHKQVYPDSDKE